MNEGKEVMVQEAPQAGPLSVVQVRGQINQIQALMKDCMQENQHYGKIPGTPKPTLLKAGAEKLALMFRLDPQYEPLNVVQRDDLISYTVRCQLYSITTGQRIASGMGSCNSREKKYKHASENVYELDNTILKMACKRALVAAVLNGTAASDIFTQDVEEMEGIAHTRPASPNVQTQAPASAPAGNLISEKQGQRFFAIYRANGKTDAQAQAYLKKAYGIDSIRDIPRSIYDAVCQWAQTRQDALGEVLSEEELGTAVEP